MRSESQKTRILLVGGGTGGHFYPLISIAEALNRMPLSPKLYYAGPDAYDPEALKAQNIEFIRITAGKKRRYFSPLNFFDIFKTLFGIVAAICKLYVIYPDVVMSKGGYTSVPIVLAAFFLRIPIIVHESDAVFGKANKIGSRFARHVIVAYEEAMTGLKNKSVFNLGIPVRQELLQPPRSGAISTLGIDPERPVILVIGGSQGAERVNRLILDSLDELLGDFSVVHQTGKQNIELCTISANTLIPDPEKRKHYHPVAFLDAPTLNDAYHVANIIISRAGSNSIYEIALHNKPSILIPIPEGISHDQRTNAYAYARTGAAIVMEEKNLQDSLLRAEIDRIMQSDGVSNAMGAAAGTFGKRDAAQHISELIAKVAQEH